MNDAPLHWATRRLHIAAAHAAGTNQRILLGTGKLTRVTFALRFAVSGVYSLPRLCLFLVTLYGFWFADSDCTTFLVIEMCEWNFRVSHSQVITILTRSNSGREFHRIRKQKLVRRVNWRHGTVHRVQNWISCWNWKSWEKIEYYYYRMHRYTSRSNTNLLIFRKMGKFSILLSLKTYQIIIIYLHHNININTYDRWSKVLPFESFSTVICKQNNKLLRPFSSILINIHRLECLKNAMNRRSSWNVDHIQRTNRFLFEYLWRHATMVKANHVGEYLCGHYTLKAPAVHHRVFKKRYAARNGTIGIIQPHQ